MYISFGYFRDTHWVQQRVGVAQPQEQAAQRAGYAGRFAEERPDQRQNEERQPAHGERAHDDAQRGGRLPLLGQLKPQLLAARLGLLDHGRRHRRRRSRFPRAAAVVTVAVGHHHQHRALVLAHRPADHRTAAPAPVAAPAAAGAATLQNTSCKHDEPRAARREQRHLNVPGSNGGEGGGESLLYEESPVESSRVRYNEVQTADQVNTGDERNRMKTID